MSVMNKEELSELILQNQKEMYVLAYSILQNQSDKSQKTCKCKILADKDSDQCIPFSNHKTTESCAFC